ncbi:MAG: AOC03_06830 family ribosome hibernation factor [Anaerolineae bacterium]
MNRQDIRLLQQVVDYPCLTITLPTHRTSPDNKQDRPRLKNLVAQATARLLTEFNKREMEALFTRLEGLVASISFRNTLDGLVLCVSKDIARSFMLTTPVAERVVVDKSFLTRDLVYELNHAARYWVLVLSEKPTRLFEGNNDNLTEVQTGGFPMVKNLPGGELRLPGGFGIRKSAIRDERQRQFLRQVDAALKPFLVDEPLPLVVVGIGRNLAFWQEVSDHNSALVATLAGNHDKASVFQLAKLAWPLMQEHVAKNHQLALDRLAQAVNEGKVVSEMSEIWRLAHEGRGELLLVEEGFHYPAHVDASGSVIRPAADAATTGVIDDAVDAVIETLMSMQGKVVFMPDGALETYQRIALITRY